MCAVASALPAAWRPRMAGLRHRARARGRARRRRRDAGVAFALYGLQFCAASGDLGFQAAVIVEGGKLEALYRVVDARR